MSQYHDRPMLMGVAGLLPQIRGGEIPDVYFSWEAGTGGNTRVVRYKVHGYTFAFTKESVSTVGQNPPHIYFKLECNTYEHVDVYVTYPTEATVSAARAAAWAAFEAFLNLPDTVYMQTRDAREYPATGFQ